LYSEKAQIAGYLGFLSGVLATSGGIVLSNPTIIRTGCVLLGFTLMTLGFNLAIMLKHFFRPELKPLAGSAPRPPGLSATGRLNRGFPSPS